MWLPLDILAGLWTADPPRFSVPEKDGIQKCTRKPLADTNREERPLGFPVLEKDGIQKCTPKPLADTNRKERPLGFPDLGGED